MNRKQLNTLKAIFENPVRSDIAWKDIEKLFEASGAEISEGKGSRIRISPNGVRAIFHRPHPQRETDRGAVKLVRRFLQEAGIE